MFPRAPAGESGSVLTLRGRTYDLATRPLVMGILNRTRDSFFDAGENYRLDALLRAAERQVADGADLLDVGARPGGVGTLPVSREEERDLVAETVRALGERFDVPVSVDTRDAAVAAAGFAAGAVLGNDMSGFRDPGYLPAAVAAGASVVATHSRLPPGVPDPDPVYSDVVTDVATALRRLAATAEAAGLPPARVVVDPGLDLGKTWSQSVRLLAHLDAFAALGHPVLVAASNKIFLGRLLGLDKDERATATVAACTAGALAGGDILRVHDVRAGRQVADLVGALRSARQPSGI